MTSCRLSQHGRRRLLLRRLGPRLRDILAHWNWSRKRRGRPRRSCPTLNLTREGRHGWKSRLPGVVQRCKAVVVLV